MLYFAYGSNLSLPRLRQRVPSAELITVGTLREHRLLFHKIGRDGSAKCDAFFSGQGCDFVYGAVYRIDPSQKHNLDQVEGVGLGYAIKTVTIHSAQGREIEAFTYYATQIDPGIKPFHWYKEHVLAGARELGFPEKYIALITSADSVDDANVLRKEQEMSLYRAYRKME